MSNVFPDANGRFLIKDAQGPREEQQDAAICLANRARSAALIVVSDGVGGNKGGRLASQKVTELARQLWKERQEMLGDPSEDLATLCRVAHEHINDEDEMHGLSPRATIVALYLTATRAHWIYSGDSRLYHFRGGKLVSRTEDHSVIQLMVNQGIVKEKDMGSHPHQGALFQCLGGSEYKEPVQGMAEITPEDGFLLCTDGFWERTTVEEMSKLLFGTRSEAEGRLARALASALKRNGPKGDNVTVALALPASEKNAKRDSRSPRLAITAIAAVIVLAATWMLQKHAPTKEQSIERHSENLPESKTSRKARQEDAPYGSRPAREKRDEDFDFKSLIQKDSGNVP